MVVLEIDRGNTWTKWRVMKARDVLCAGRQASADVYKELFADAEQHQPERVRIANVADEDGMEKLLAGLRQRLSTEIGIASSGETAAGVRNGYDDPRQLGVDRWLAMIAARNIYPDRSLCVIDCGSAITVDAIDASGQHLGGYIAPGRNVMCHSLSHESAGIKPVDMPAGINNPSWGKSTAEAVVGGVYWMTHGLIHHCAAISGGDTLLVFTGGDAEEGLASLGRDTQYQTCLHGDLVLEGLGHVLP